MKLALVAPTDVGVLEIAGSIADQVPVDLFTLESESRWQNRSGVPSGAAEPEALRRFEFRADYSVAPSLSARLAKVVQSPQTSPQLEHRWLQERAAYSSVLLDELSSRQNDYDALFYFALAWQTTVVGLEQIAAPSVVVPATAEGSLAGVRILREALARADGFLWGSAQQEEAFAEAVPATTPRALVRDGSSSPFLEMADLICRPSGRGTAG